MATIDVDVTCWKCKRNFVISCDKSKYNLWKNGELIQNALADLSSDQRELLISGTCGECWDILFPLSDDEDDECDDDTEEDYDD